LYNRNTILLFFPIFDYGGKGCEYIPFSILHLERAIRHLNLNVILIDENDNPEYDNIIEDNKNDILLAGVSAITGYQIEGGIRFSEKVKMISPDAKIVWGGWHPTILPEQTLNESYIDFVIVGQGEKPFGELTQTLLNNKDYFNVKGIAFKKEEHIILNVSNDFCNLNNFPEVDYSLIDINKYVLKTDFSERRLMYFATYGCPFNCPFCSGSQIFKKKWYPKNIETIIADLKYFKEKASIDSILFWDDNFFSNKKFVLDFAQRIIEEKLNIVWDGSAHAKGFLSLFNEQDVQFLYKAGLRRVSTGAESGNDNVLEIIKDNLLHKDVLSLIALLKRNGITTFFSTMVGFPLNEGDEIKSTFNLIRKAKYIDSNVKVQINIYTPYPQTPLYKDALEKGFKEPQQLSDWIYHSPAKFKPPWIASSFYETLDAFMNFYLPFSEKDCYKRAPQKFQKTAFLIYKILRPFILLRFKFNFFSLNFDWLLFKFLLKRYNNKNQDNFRFYAYGIFGV